MGTLAARHVERQAGVGWGASVIDERMGQIDEGLAVMLPHPGAAFNL